MKGLGFTLGWLLTLVGIVAVTVLVTGGKPLIPKSAPSTAQPGREAGHRRGARVHRLPAPAQAGIERAQEAARGWPASTASTPWPPPGLGFLLQPWVLVAAGVATITQAKLSSRRSTSPSSPSASGARPATSCMETYAALRPGEGQDEARRDAPMDQHAHGPGDRVPVVGARAVPHGQEHLRPGERRLARAPPDAQPGARDLRLWSGGVSGATLGRIDHDRGSSDVRLHVAAAEPVLDVPDVRRGVPADLLHHLVLHRQLPPP